ncbi:hypothetical protein AB0B66_38365 [Catellatospora sp. NPDC049111]|uniref:hypothetical protein n=1 Tax=Catellatospora sp. NPDC049111 TaxID=3155271 RepID=UPI00340E903D
MSVDHGELMNMATTYLRTRPEHAGDIAAWLAWTLPRDVDAVTAAPADVAAFCAGTGRGRDWAASWRRPCRDRLAYADSVAQPD